MCLYSAASMLPRRVFAMPQSLGANSVVAVVTVGLLLVLRSCCHEQGLLLLLSLASRWKEGIHQPNASATPLALPAVGVFILFNPRP